MDESKDLSKLKNKVRKCWNDGIDLWSAVLFSDRYSTDDLLANVDIFDPSSFDARLIHTITVPLSNEATLSYLYFGSRKSNLLKFAKALEGVDEAFAGLPNNPGFDCPSEVPSTDYNLLRWTSLVYWIGRTCNEPYLQVELDGLLRDPMFGWELLSTWQFGTPERWMLLQAGGMEHFNQFERQPDEPKRSYPDVIHMYSGDDHCQASIAAIDLYASRLLREKIPATTPPKKRTRREEKKFERHDRDYSVLRLKRYILKKHAKNDEPVHYKLIMADLNWSHTKLVHTMNALFAKQRRGMGGLTYYKKYFAPNFRLKGVRIFGKDGRVNVDAEVRDDDEDDN